MKNFAIVAAICSSVAFAVVIKDVDVLIERGEQLSASANKLVAEHKNNSRAHLTSSAEYELKDLDRTLAALRALEKNVTLRIHEVNVLEERLLEHENRLNEELDFVEDVYKHHNAANKTANELIEYAEVLLKEAKAVLASHQDHGHLELNSIRYEVQDIESLVKRIQANPTKSSFNEHSLVMSALCVLLSNEFNINCFRNRF